MHKKLLACVLLLFGCLAPLANGVTAHVHALGPVTSMHYTANGNFDSSGKYLPGADGFNVADVSSTSELTDVPSGVKAMVWVGTCNGADSSFQSAVQPYVGSSKVYAWYLMDEPDPTGTYKPQCTGTNLKAESDWLHAHAPGTKTFIILMNMSSSTSPSFPSSYSYANTGLDLYGIDPYPCRSELSGCDYTEISKYVSAAVAAGVPVSHMVPVYQTFGGGAWVDDGGGSYSMPTSTQMDQILSTWASSVPNPVMDYAYSWGSQNGDTALDSSAALQSIFASHNATQTSGGSTGSGSTTPTPTRSSNKTSVQSSSGGQSSPVSKPSPTAQKSTTASPSTGSGQQTPNNQQNAQTGGISETPATTTSKHTSKTGLIAWIAGLAGSVFAGFIVYRRLRRSP